MSLSRYRLVSAATAVAAVVLVGCADARSALAGQVASSFSLRLADGDFASACELLAPATRERVERAGPCSEVLARARLLAGARVLSSEVWGEQARVLTTGDTVFLIDSEQGWQVAAAGCRPRGEAPYDCALEGP